MTRFPSIPPNREKNATIDKLKELVEIWKGDRGDRRDKVVTVRDLIDGGLARLTNGGFAPSTTVTNIIVEDTPPIIPGPLTNLSAAGGFKVNFLNWEGTNQAGYAYTEVFRHTSDNLADAVLVGTEIAPIFTDKNVVSGQQYFYWVRAVSTTDNRSAFNATAGTAATPVLEPAYIAGQLTDMINESMLVAALSSRIDLIDNPGTGLIDSLSQEVTDRINAVNSEAASRASEISAEAAARIAAINDEIANRLSGDANLQGQIDSLVISGGDSDGNINAILTRINAVGGSADSLETFYANYTNLDSQVNHGTTGLSAVYTISTNVENRIDDVDGQNKTIEQFWTDFAAIELSVTDVATGLSATYNKVATLENRADAVDGVDKTIEQFWSDYESIELTVNHGSTGLAATYTRLVNAENRIDTVDGATKTIEQFWTDFQSIELAVNDGANGLSATATRATNLENRVNGVDGFNKTLEQFWNDHETLELAVNHGSTGLSATVTRLTSLENRVDSVDGAGKTLEQLYTDFNSVELAVNHGTTGLNAAHSRATTLENRLDDVYGDASNKTIESVATDVDNLEVTVNDAGTGVSALNTKYSQAKARLDDTGSGKTIEAITTEHDTLKAQIDNVTTGLTATYDKAVTAEATANTADNKADVNATEILAARGGEADLDARLQVMAAVSTALGALWTVKLDVNGKVTGIGIYNDGSTSEMVVSSEAVYFIDPAQSATEFDPTTNYASVDAVRATQLVFGYAEVAGAKRFVINVPAYIEDGTITTAQIQNAMITMAQISDLLVSEAQIADAAITSAKISNIIQSDNFISGSLGWLINKNGSAEFHDITLYDGNGNVAFRSGAGAAIQTGEVPDLRAVTDNPTMELQDANAKPRAIRIDSYDLGVLDETYYDYEDVDQTILQVDPGVSADFTVTRPAIRVLPGETYNIKARVRCSTADGSVVTRCYEYGSELANGRTYVSSRLTDATGQEFDTQTYLTSDVAATTWIDIEETYTPSAGVVWFSPTITKTDSGVYNTMDVDYLYVEATRAQVSSTFIRDAAITRAKIEDLAVDTLQIAGNAVSYTYVVEDAGPETYNSEDAVPTVVDFYFDHGHDTTLPCLLSVYFDLDDTSVTSGGNPVEGNGALFMRYWQDGVMVASSNWTGDRANFTTGYPKNFPFVLDIPPGGSQISIDIGAYRGSLSSRNWTIDQYVTHIQAVKK